MTKKEAMRQTHQQNVLMSLGFTRDEAEQLRRISMTLHRWHELECGTDRGCIERGFRVARNQEKPISLSNPVFAHDEKGHPYWANHGGDRVIYTRIPDREKGALKRLAKIIARVNSERNESDGDMMTYIQTDPRGAALYILRPGDVPAGESADAHYTRGICVH